ncbi:MAG: acyl-ACP--UDP-N-acetylglucosamine O-acyltransferase [Bacteroidales bacterium]
MEFKCIHPGAKIGEGVKIDQFSYIAENVEIGEGTLIGPHVTILDYVKIGRNCKIHPGAIIGGEPQDYKFGGEITYVEIGDNTIIREYVTVNRGTKEGRGKTVVGENCMLMAYTHIAHDCIVGNNTIIVSYAGLSGYTEVGEFANIGGHVAIHQFSKIGAYTMVGGGSVLNKDIPPYSMVAGRPITFYNLNLVGLRRNGFTKEQIDRISAIYRIIYRGGLNTSDACKKIEEEFEETTEKRVILNFIKSSKRGIVKRISGSRSDG